MRKTMPNTINRGAIQYELTNHLGNVLAVVTGKKLRDADYNYLPDLVSTQDYSPFGMQIEGRSWNSKEYRFGFQGQQKDDEIYNEGNAYSAQFWEYDARLSRRWNIDPLPKPYESLYATFANNPTSNVDPDGRDSIVFRRWMANGEVITTTNYCVDNGPKLYYVAYDEIYNQSLREEMIPIEKVGSPSTKTSDATPSEKEPSHMPYWGLDRLNVTLQGTSETENTWADENIGKPVGKFIYENNPLSSLPTMYDGVKTAFTGTTMEGYHFNSTRNRMMYSGTSIIISALGIRNIFPTKETPRLLEDITENSYLNFINKSVSNSAIEMDKK